MQFAAPDSADTLSKPMANRLGLYVRPEHVGDRRWSWGPMILMYEDMAIKFADHFLWIARAMNQTGPEGMWDEEDGFYYDVLRMPDGSARRLKVRSMVGLLPLCATTVIEPWQRERMPRVLLKTLRERLQRMPELAESVLRHRPRPLRLWRTWHCCLGERGQVTPDSHTHARRERVPSLVLTG